LARYRSFRDLDWPLLIISLIISTLGVLQIYSATHGETKWHNAWWKQIIFIVLGLGLMWFTTSIDYHTLLGQVPILYSLSLVGLLATVVVGKVVFHGRRWIEIPFLGVNFQISEFVKLVIILMVARYLAELKSDEVSLRDLFKLGGLVVVPVGLVYLQPDLGTAMTCVSVLAAGILLAGLRWQYMAGIALVLALASPVGWYLIKDYQRTRFLTYLDPSRDQLGAGYQVIQSKIAIGHGGIWGAGLTKGTQTQLRFLPAAHNDLIFSGFAEEHGFVGVVVVLGLYFLLLMQIVQNAQTAPDRAGMYICMGVAALLLCHLLVNVGMVAGEMPLTGIPLPLMSAGGSITMSVFVMLGLVNNVRLRRFAS
jgi:rod shape determining protein RodA